MSRQKWKNDELEYLKENITKLTLTQIATALNRPLSSVHHKAEDLNLLRKIKPKPTICWDCAKATGGCSWSKSFVPVDGWVTQKTRLYPTQNKGGIVSYAVQECPEFIKG